MSHDADTPTINWVQVLAGALAAVTSAVLLSTVGVAGTLIGAALGSVAASVGSAVYGRGIETSRRQMAAQAAALRSVGKARTRLDEVGDDVQDTVDEARLEDAAHELDHAEHTLSDETLYDETPAAAPDQEDATGSGRAWKDLPWKRIALASAGLFLVVMLAITVFELVAGQSVSELTGGSTDGRSTTVPGLNGTETSPTPTPSPTPTEEPTTSPTADVTPTGEPTPTEEPTATEETPTEEPTPTVEPTATETATPDTGDGAAAGETGDQAGEKDQDVPVG
jgi:hypothetical protein